MCLPVHYPLGAEIARNFRHPPGVGVGPAIAGISVTFRRVVVGPERFFPHTPCDRFGNVPGNKGIEQMIDCPAMLLLKVHRHSVQPRC